MIPTSPDALRQQLVVDLRAITEEEWRQVCEPAADVKTILDRLGQSPRCRRYNGVLPLVTPFQKETILAGRSADLALHIGGQSWLVLEPLDKGKGGLGEVFIGSPIPCVNAAKQLVAIKRPLPKRSGALRSIHKEIAALRGIRHPNLAQLLAADENAGLIVTRLVDGPSLQTVLAKQHRFPVAKTVQISIEVCRGLMAAHATNLIHRDIKPANIILESEKGAVLIDFGLAQDVAGPREGWGTPYFIAPEIFFGGKHVDVRADIYGLGATLYCLLIGQPPRFQQCLFPVHARTSQRMSLDDLRFRIVDSPLDCDPAALRPDTPQALSDLIIQCLRSDPRKRPTSARDLYAELDGIQKQFHRVSEIEHDLQKLSLLLLTAYRQAAGDTDFSDISQNARRLREHVQTSVSQLRWLPALRSDAVSLTSAGADSVLHRGTVGLLVIIEALCQGLDAVGSLSTDRDKQKAWLVTILDALRDAGVMSLSLAHAWLNLMQQLGCRRLPLGPV